jgi:hypothetical protein
MKPIYKLNGGNGATLCKNCYAMISVGWIEETLCRECKGALDLKETKRIRYEKK